MVGADAPGTVLGIFGYNERACRRTHRIGGEGDLGRLLVGCRGIHRHVYLLAGKDLALLPVGGQGYQLELHGVTGAVEGAVGVEIVHSGASVPLAYILIGFGYAHRRRPFVRRCLRRNLRRILVFLEKFLAESREAYQRITLLGEIIGTDKDLSVFFAVIVILPGIDRGILVGLACLCVGHVHLVLAVALTGREGHAAHIDYLIAAILAKGIGHHVDAGLAKAEVGLDLFRNVVVALVSGHTLLGNQTGVARYLFERFAAHDLVSVVETVNQELALVYVAAGKFKFQRFSGIYEKLPAVYADALGVHIVYHGEPLLAVFRLGEKLRRLHICLADFTIFLAVAVAGAIHVAFHPAQLLVYQDIHRRVIGIFLYAAVQTVEQLVLLGAELRVIFVGFLPVVLAEAVVLGLHHLVQFQLVLLLAAEGLQFRQVAHGRLGLTLRDGCFCLAPQALVFFQGPHLGIGIECQCQQ